MTYKLDDGKKVVTSYGGAAFAPEKIQPSGPAPEDFDDFWAKQIASMQKLPLNPTLERVDVGNPKFEYYRSTLDHINGTKVYGQLAKPVDGKNLPAMLQVQWAGVYPLDRSWVIQHARNGWLAVNISPHNLPIAEKQEFYQEKAKTELDDYPGIGNESRDTSYFLRMFLSCRRTVDYILTREDWNKKTLVVHGGSQGGYQAIVTAGLCPEVTAMSANVPAGCDHTGKAAGRETGWPQWASRTWKGRDEKKMLIAARYFDAMHFASRVKYQPDCLRLAIPSAPLKVSWPRSMNSRGRRNWSSCPPQTMLATTRFTIRSSMRFCRRTSRTITSSDTEWVPRFRRTRCNRAGLT